jgi:SAM-dependent methyltransferase
LFVTSRALNPAVFGVAALVRFGALNVVRSVPGTRWHIYRRTADAVRAEYDPSYDEFADEFRKSAWPVEEYALTGPRAELSERWDFANKLDGRVIIGGSEEVRRRILVHLEAEVRRVQAASVIEAGCGNGRNLLYLKSRMPDLTITGLDLSEPAVRLAREAASRYGLAGDFIQHDITAPWPVEKTDVVFSVHALEQLPDTALQTLRVMRGHARKAVVLLEPLPDLWQGPVGLAGRLRARFNDRLPAGAFDGLPIESKELLPDGLALNRTTKVVLAAEAG